MIKKHESMPSLLRVGDMISKLNGQWFRVDALFDRDGVERDFITTEINVTDAELLNPEYWELERELLFEAADGEPIYDGDVIYMLNIDNWETKCMRAKKGVANQKNTLIFSKKDNAHTYTWQNKRELSYNDIKYWIDNNLDFPFLERYIKNQLISN